MVKRLIFVLAMLLSFLGLNTTAMAQSILVGEWLGTANGEVYFDLHVVEEDDGLKATVDYPADDVYGIPVKDLTYVDEVFTGVVEDDNGTEMTFTGTFDEDGNITGTFTDGWEEGKFKLQRAKPRGDQ